MKNNKQLKKFILIICFISIVFISIFSVINIIEYRIYTKNFNNKISAIISKINEEYPDVSTNEIIRILNSRKTKELDILQNYGIDSALDSAIMENKYCSVIFLIFNFILLITLFGILIYIFVKYNLRRSREIIEITNYVEELNKRNYSLSLDDISEGEISILKNEIYKTTVNLKELAEISKKDKVDLKNSLEDISHQLKTPITSILVMLDNILDDPQMDEDIRQMFLRDIKREVSNVNFLVQAILKLSKFDANTIIFNNEDIEVDKLLLDVIRNVSSLSDLKNVRVDVKSSNNTVIFGDYKWQKEAITNILKNAIEHSNENSSVNIECVENKAYTQINVINTGSPIAKEELPHIFERFYKGANSSPDSIGIGLSLSKNIIEKNNGKIEVKSNEESTIFTIKYFKIYTTNNEE